MKMIRRVIYLAAVVLVLFACGDPPVQGARMDVGTLLGYDKRMSPCMMSQPCSCPGGIFVAIQGSTYRFLEMPKNSTLILDGKFPIPVRLTWDESKSCPGELIVVSQISLSR
jgi:hypothetical protein